jgi:hypothetical protein
MRNAAATGGAAVPRFERVGFIARLRSGFLLADLRFMTVTTGFRGALAGENRARSPQTSIGCPIENQQWLVGAAPGVNRQEPLRVLGSCSSVERATAGAMVELQP